MRKQLEITANQSLRGPWFRQPIRLVQVLKLYTVHTNKKIRGEVQMFCYKLFYYSKSIWTKATLKPQKAGKYLWQILKILFCSGAFSPFLGMHLFRHPLSKLVIGIFCSSFALSCVVLQLCIPPRRIIEANSLLPTTKQKRFSEGGLPTQKWSLSSTEQEF